MIAHERLIRLIAENKMTDEEFCKEIGITIKTLNNWKTKNTTSSTLIKISKCLGASTDYILGLTDLKNNQCENLKLSEELERLVNIIKKNKLDDRQIDIINQDIMDLVNFKIKDIGMMNCK